MIGRLIVRGFALAGAVVTAWIGFSWARLSIQRWRAAAQVDTRRSQLRPVG